MSSLPARLPAQVVTKLYVTVLCIQLIIFLRAIADENTIKGSFEKGKNTFVFGNTIVAMESNDDSFYQTQYNIHFQNNTANYEQVNSKPFNIVIGSNNKGQSYLYWNQNQLYQLPISYFTVNNNWCNSPGYPFSAEYNRSITPRCLECHSTYAKVISPPGIHPEQFNRTQIIYGINCEKMSWNCGCACCLSKTKSG